MSKMDLGEMPVAIGMLAAVIVFFVMVTKALSKLVSTDILLKGVINGLSSLGSYFMSIIGVG